MIVSITGPSGVGKSTLMEGITLHLPEARPLLSVTTRPSRASGEIEGEYLHVSQAVFLEMERAGVFLWVRHIHGNSYGTRISTINEALSDTNTLYIPLLTVDVLKELHAYALLRGEKMNLKHLYLTLTDTGELRRRFRVRGDSLEEINRRLKDCESWNEDVRTLGVRLKMVEADWPKEKVLAQALTYIEKVRRKT